MVNGILGYLMWPVFWLVFPLRLRATLLVRVGDEVLVVKHRIYFGQWNLPGGGVKLGEPASAAVCREVREELGVDVTQQDLVELSKSFDTAKEYGILSRHKFYLYEPAQKPPVTLNREIREHKWVHINTKNIGADALKAIEKVKMLYY